MDAANAARQRWAATTTTARDIQLTAMKTPAPAPHPVRLTAMEPERMRRLSPPIHDGESVLILLPSAAHLKHGSAEHPETLIGGRAASFIPPMRH